MSKQSSCVVIFSTDGDMVAVTRRGSDKIGLPGGKVDPGETMLIAAIRECHEETGLALDAMDMFSIYRKVDEFDGFDVETFLYTKPVSKSDIELAAKDAKEKDLLVYLTSPKNFVDNSPFKQYNLNTMKMLDKIIPILIDCGEVHRDDVSNLLFKINNMLTLKKTGRFRPLDLVAQKKLCR